ncbi:MAG: hypothetical protein K2V38_00445, partial [Gemmataceae bacterium]|nr:hypothetical protein [Gemmataceae bacterium]
LRRVTSASTLDLVLFDLPDKRLSAFVARLRRLRAGPLGVRLLPDPHAGRAWVTVASPPPSIILWSDDSDAQVRAFCPQSPNVWTLRGWEHPLAGHLTIPIGGVLLCAPGTDPVLHHGPVPAPADDEFALPRRESRATAGERLVVTAAFKLTRAPATASESLWVFSTNEQEGFRAFCRNADERLLRQFELATVEAGGDTRLLVRRTSDASGATLSGLGRGFAVDPRLATLFVPAGYHLRPRIRLHELARELAVTPTRLTWLDPTEPAGFVVCSAPLSAFRSLADQVEYLPPWGVPLAAERVSDDLFPLARFALRLEPVAEPDPVPPTPTETPARPRSTAQGGWVSKSLGRVVTWVRGRPDRPPPAATSEST